MSVFALWLVVFWKYVFVLLEYVVFFKNVFSYFRKLNVSVSIKRIKMYFTTIICIHANPVNFKTLKHKNA